MTQYKNVIYCGFILFFGGVHNCWVKLSPQPFVWYHLPLWAHISVSDVAVLTRDHFFLCQSFKDTVIELKGHRGHLLYISKISIAVLLSGSQELLSKSESWCYFNPFLLWERFELAFNPHWHRRYHVYRIDLLCVCVCVCVHVYIYIGWHCQEI